MKAYFGGLAQSLPAKAAGWTGVPAERIAAYNADAIPESLKGSVDRVLMIRSLHNLWRNGLLYRELMTVRDLLKEDGFLGIVQHRAKGDAPAAYTNGEKGYMREDDVIAMVEAHGFRYSGMTDVNANPKDTADHPQGVWELPPSLRTKREDLKAIGESDRMTLLFRKRP
jgi:predicted methyltransferase